MLPPGVGPVPPDNNPSNPPIHIEWGEQTKDEMGSISLIAVPHVESDLETIRRDVATRDRTLALEKMGADPELAKKVKRMLAD